jgi:outer membrane protein OmpA-like peptidoglycan-associated protein
MTDIPTLKLLIIGHTCSEGYNNNYYLKLSTKRAIAIYTYLQKQAIPAERLSTEGKEITLLLLQMTQKKVEN